jgi:hypothetical protein
MHTEASPPVADSVPPRLARASGRRLGPAAALLAALWLAACGGGGDDGAPAPGSAAGTPATTAQPGAAVPGAVSQTLPASGGRVEAALADGGRAVLEVAAAPSGAASASAASAGATVTLTPAAPLPGEWTRLVVAAPAPARDAGLTLRVRPPARVAPGQVPVLQIVTADGPILLRTRALAGGEIEARLPAPAVLPSQARTAQGASGRMQALSGARRLADGTAEEATTVAGAAFIATCQAPDAVLRDALRVIENASSAGAVFSALSTLGLVADRCVQPGLLDEAALLRVNLALQDLAARLPRLYADALAAWKPIDFGFVEVQFEPFRRGVRRLLALCAAAGEIGAPLTCPLTTDYEPEYSELGNGFAAASDERQHQGSLRLMFERLLPLAGEAAAFGLTQAAQDLRNALASIADRLMDRAYALCSHGELHEWRVYVEQGGFSRRGFAAVQRAMAYCGIGASAAALRRAADGTEQRGEARPFAPGAFDGAGRTLTRSVSVVHDGFVAIAVGGDSTRCSRVLGTPQAIETVSVRTGSTQLGDVELNSQFRPEQRESREIQFSVRHLLEVLGRAPDAMDPIELAIWRRGVAPLACTDSNGAPMVVAADEVKLYTLELDFGSLRPETGPLPAATAGRRYEATLRARGGTAPLTWTATGLPAGLVLDAASGLVSGTPVHDAIGRHVLAITVSDAGGQSVNLQRELEVAPLVLHGEIHLTVLETLTRDDALGLLSRNSPARGTAQREASSTVTLAVQVSVPRPGATASFELRGQTVEGSLLETVNGRARALERFGDRECLVEFDTTATLRVPALTRSHVAGRAAFGLLAVDALGQYTLDFGIEDRLVTGSGEHRIERRPRPPLEGAGSGCENATGTASIETFSITDGTTYLRTSALPSVPADGATSGTRAFEFVSSPEAFTNFGVRHRVQTTVRWNLVPR